MRREKRAEGRTGILSAKAGGKGSGIVPRALVAVGSIACLLSACGSPGAAEASATEQEALAETESGEATGVAETMEADEAQPASIFEETAEAVADPWQESAADGEIDFAAQYEIRPGIIGWLYVPGTEIDCPVYGEKRDDAVWLDDTSSADMIDFNETVHGKAEKKGDAFATLYSYTDPLFFAGHGEIRYYQPYGAMTYAVMAAWETEERDLNISLLEGTEEEKKAFLAEVKTPMIGKNLQEGHLAEMTAQNFYLTLSAKQSEASDRQYIVVGMLAGVE